MVHLTTVIILGLKIGKWIKAAPNFKGTAAKGIKQKDEQPVTLQHVGM